MRDDSTVRPEWVDDNDHMNVAFYVLVFDLAAEAFHEAFGLGTPYRVRTNHSTFAVESHVTYDRELKVGEPVRVASRLLGFDEKKFHTFHVMHHSEKGFQAASMELMELHIDLDARKVVPMPADTQARLTVILAAHAGLECPREIGRVMGIKRKSVS